MKVLPVYFFHLFSLACACAMIKKHANIHQIFESANYFKLFLKELFFFLKYRNISYFGPKVPREGLWGGGI